MKTTKEVVKIILDEIMERKTDSYQVHTVDPDITYDGIMIDSFEAVTNDDSTVSLNTVIMLSNAEDLVTLDVTKIADILVMDKEAQTLIFVPIK